MCVVWLGACHAGSVIAVSIVMFLYVFRRVGRKCLLARVCLPHKRGTRTKMPPRLGSPYRAASHNQIIKWFCSNRTSRWHIFPLQTKWATPCAICDNNERLNLISYCVFKEQLKNSNGRRGLPTTHRDKIVLQVKKNWHLPRDEKNSLNFGALDLALPPERAIR